MLVICMFRCFEKGLLIKVTNSAFYLLGYGKIKFQLFSFQHWTSNFLIFLFQFSTFYLPAFCICVGFQLSSFIYRHSQLNKFHLSTFYSFQTFKFFFHVCCVSTFIFRFPSFNFKKLSFNFHLFSFYHACLFLSLLYLLQSHASNTDSRLTNSLWLRIRLFFRYPI